MLFLFSVLFLFITKKGLVADFQKSQEYLEVTKEAAKASYRLTLFFSLISFITIAIYFLSIASHYGNGSTLVSRNAAFFLIGLKVCSSVLEHFLVFENKKYSKFHFYLGKIEHVLVGVIAVYTLYLGLAAALHHPF